MTIRHGKLRKLVAEIFQRKGEALGQACSVFNRFRQIAKELAHFPITLQMALAVSRAQLAGNIKMGVLANAGENIENLASVGLRVLHAIGGQDRQSIMSGKINKLPVHSFFAAQKMTLNLNVNIFATERVDEKLCAGSETLGSAHASRAGDGALAIANFFFAGSSWQVCTPQSKERDQPFGEFRQFAPLHGAHSFFAAEMRLRQQLA